MEDEQHTGYQNVLIQLEMSTDLEAPNTEFSPHEMKLTTYYQYVLLGCSAIHDIER